MFKLTVVNGPARGTPYPLKEGETTLGRIAGNDIVLTSAKVSKKHCTLVTDSRGVTVKDLGSSNGTFVNGVLTKTKKLSPGDRLSVGEFVLELTLVEEAKPVPVNFGNVLPLRPGGMGGTMPGVSGISGLNVGAPMAAMGGAGAGAVPPKDLKTKIQLYFETYILNFLYNLNEKQEWRSIMTMMFVVLTVGAAVVSVYPTVDRVQDKMESEARERALLIARQIVDRNSSFLFEKLDSKVDVAFAEREKGVVSAYIVDMEGRVLAPARKLNQYLTEANEAAFSALARNAFYNFDKLEERWRIYGDQVAVAVPLRVFDSRSGKNTTVAAGIVFYDRTQLLLDPGTIGLTYIQAIILSAIIGVVIFFSLLRLTLRPLQSLNEEIDLVLKGSASAVNKKYKMEEIDPLIDVINAALQRIPAQASGNMSATDPNSGEDFLNVVRFVADHMPDAGVLVLSAEKRVLHMNAYMEEITGIRADKAVGDEMSNVARDAAFASFIDDLIGRAAGNAGALSEDFEFSGNAYKIDCHGLGNSGFYKSFVFIATKSG